MIHENFWLVGSLILYSFFGAQTSGSSRLGMIIRFL